MIETPSRLRNRIRHGFIWAPPLVVRRPVSCIAGYNQVLEFSQIPIVPIHTLSRVFPALQVSRGRIQKYHVHTYIYTWMQLQFAVLAAPRKFFFASQENFPDSNYKRELYSGAIPHLRVARAGAPLQPHTSHSDMQIDLILYICRCGTIGTVHD